MQNQNLVQNSNRDNSFDILICGAGLIGASLALALAPLQLRIAVTEALPLRTEIDLQSDGRSLALNYASVKILEAIGVWPQLAEYATPIKTVHVSERGRFGKLRFNAEDEQVAALGYVIPAPLLGATLNRALLAQQAIHLFNPAKVTALTKKQDLLLRGGAGGEASIFCSQAKYGVPQPTGPRASELNDCNNNESFYEVTIQNAEAIQTISARLVIAADGANSLLRELMGIVTQSQIYNQSALATRITTTLPLNNMAYERFISGGALALLPLAGNKAALILTGEDKFIQALNAFDENTFLQQVQSYFGQRLGAFLQVEKRHVYPLKSISANEQVKESFILLGNAAHTMHPIAAQGFNLGLQDVALLAELIAKAVDANNDFTHLNYLQSYEKQRQKAQQRIMQFTHNLITIFAHDFLPLSLARSTSLKLLDLIPPMKHRLAAQLMGVSGNLPRLTLGLPLKK